MKLRLPLLLIIGPAALLPVPASAGVIWWVNNQASTCSDVGTGGESAPFCSIQAAARRAFPGDSILVHPGTYREQVVPTISGLPGVPITYEAVAPGVIVLGTQDLSQPEMWSSTTAAAWSRPYAPPSSPRQVFLDGGRLTGASGLSEMTPNSFFYDESAKILYVDVGGPNPAVGHVLEAGARTYGFDLSDRTDLVVRGFDLRWQNHTALNMGHVSAVEIRGNHILETGVYGILCEASSAPVDIADNQVVAAGSVGLRLAGTTGALIAGNETMRNGFHGIELQASTGNIIERNISALNRRAEIRSAAGIDLNGGSSDNLIRWNSAYRNDDTGIQARSGSNRNVIVRNVSWSNGDHGFDANGSVDNHFISNSSAGNGFDGFSVEGGSTGTVLSNNIAVGNGLTTGEYELYVDALSIAGSSFDFDLIWRPTGSRVIKYDRVVYGTVTDFAAATGQEAHGLGADPRFADIAGGDLHLTAASPAIDAADAAAPGFLARDRDGREPVDIFDVTDSGAGTPSFVDRGAYEYDAAPVASLDVRADSSVPRLIADGSGSSDSDSTPIVAYTFDFGDGALVGPQSGAIATHTYASFGTYTVSLLVEDSGGLRDDVSVEITLTDPNAGEIHELRFTDLESLSWTARPDALAYNLYRGDLWAFADANGDGAAESYGACFASGLTDAGAMDTSVPPIGAGYFYLVTGTYAAGEGPLGPASSGAERPNPQPCP